MSLSKWILTKEEQERYIAALTEELAPLRAKAGISQGELAGLAGISRQTLSAIECGKKPMSWSTCLSLLFFFDNNLSTRAMLRGLPAYPAALLRRMNGGKDPSGELAAQEEGELQTMLKNLDQQALHSLKTLLLVEYARCRNIPGEVVLRAFDGLHVPGESPDAAVELALRNIRKKEE